MNSGFLILILFLILLCIIDGLRFVAVGVLFDRYNILAELPSCTKSIYTTRRDQNNVLVWLQNKHRIKINDYVAFGIVLMEVIWLV